MRLGGFLSALACLLGLLSTRGQDWETLQPGVRGFAVKPEGAGKSGFTLLPPAHTGLVFTNLVAEERSITNRVLLLGSGVAAGDVDGDGLADLYFCSLDGDNHLYG